MDHSTAPAYGLWSLVVICRVPYDHIPIRSWPLIRARDVLRGLIETLKAEQAT